MWVLGQLVHLGDIPEMVKDITWFLKGSVNIHVLLANASTFILMGLPALFFTSSRCIKVVGVAVISTYVCQVNL